MGEGNHLPTAEKIVQPKGRWMWMIGGAAVAVIAAGLLMQQVLATGTKAASDSPAGTARVGGSGKKPEAIMAKVGSEAITYDLLAAECYKRFGREVLDDLINRMIIQQACEKHEITVTEREISEEIARIAKKFSLDVAQWQQMLQAERNITPEQYRQSIIYPMIALRKLSGAEAADKITEKDMKEAYVRNYGPRVKARIIMFDNQRRALEIYAQLEKNPDLFEEMATKHSVDPQSRALGGQVPPIMKFGGNKLIEDAAFKMEEGDISGVIEVMPSRFVILKCEGRTEPAVVSIDQVRDQLYDDLKEAKVQTMVAEMFEKLKKDTIVENLLVPSSNRPEKTASNKEGSVIQPASGTQSKPPRSTGNLPKPSRD